ncbi:MBL fold metallo-hydrolase [Diaphorobacter aerolatus]|uniref:MBL fold metallo-hydrolase n=1 Tax=Diaphorobacter aerolatus TaxID=1288495 RepID=A0A7H0GII4_9BURK|nr:MBL fold metallo-hydrolase [Diaphorobacter aerolatus]QNP48100.1 MBL fold metallo-hydrolase [Diaphorobacter aerolatus]
MLRFKSLGSGSSGNSTIIEGRCGHAVSRLLMDCGLGIRVTAERLGAAGLAYQQLSAIFITHEHSDHVGCVSALALRHRIPVWMSEGTYRAIGSPDLHGLLRFADHNVPIDLGAFQALPFSVPHDAAQPLHLRCTDGSHHIALLTDLGHPSAEVIPYLRDCAALLIEANHDTEMLRNGRYPAFLKRRIGSDHGHLANAQTAELLRAVSHDGLTRIVAAHLSAENNRPDIAQQTLSAAIGRNHSDIEVALQRTGSDWVEIAG